MGAHHKSEVLRRQIGAEMGEHIVTAFNDALAELDAEIAQVKALREQDQADATSAVRQRTATLREDRTSLTQSSDTGGGAHEAPQAPLQLDPGTSDAVNVSGVPAPAQANADGQ